MQRRALLTLAALSTTGLAHAQSIAKPNPLPSIHNTEPITMDDVIIVGGSFAGLAGALQLGRARRKVTRSRYRPAAQPLRRSLAWPAWPRS